MPRINRVFHLDEDVNDFEWDLTEVEGSAFEKNIQALIRRDIRAQGVSCHIRSTERTADRGKDMVLEFAGDMSILGCKLVLPRNARIALAHIEIKKLNGGTLSANEFGGSLMQLQADGPMPSYFVLVTSATLTPSTLHHARQSFEARDCKLLLIDRVRLVRALAPCNEGLLLPQPDRLPALPDIAVSYCTQSVAGMKAQDDITVRSNKAFGLFLAMHNYSGEERTIKLALRSDVNWRLIADAESDLSPGEDLLFHLAPGGYRTTKLQLTQYSFEALDELRIALDLNGRPRTLEVRGPEVKFEFDPPMFGAAHSECCAQIVSDIRGDKPLRFIDLHGKAGAGKSKVLEEVEKRLAGGHVLTVSAELRPGNEELMFAKILKQIMAEMPYKETLPKRMGFKELMARCASLPALWDHCVIILEDLHHASKGLLDDLRAFCEQLDATLPLTVLVTGRDDDSVANIHYFSFIDHVAQLGASAPRLVRSVKLVAWSNQECEQFIRLTIRDVPAVVVQRVVALSENSPFGVVQAIQYLLDLSIVEVVNRNTVGVLNAELLAAKNCIPTGLQDLIDLRVQHLLAEHGPAALVVLHALALLGPALSESVFDTIFPGDADQFILGALVERQFIQTEHSRLSYAHENLQIYFLSRVETSAAGRLAAQAILRSAEALEDWSKQRIAYLHFVAGDLDKAYAELAYLFDHVHQFTNISSVAVDGAELPYIRPLVEASMALGKPVGPVAGLCKLATYLALHNQPLALALESSAYMQEKLEELELEPALKQTSLMEVRQLRAHMMLNMGYVQAAHKTMLEIAAQVTLSPPSDDNSSLMFDCYDRLQNIYHQLNHKAMFVYYSELSERIAADDGTRGLVIASRTKEYFYDDPAKFLQLTRVATAYSRERASPRHVCHGELNLCIAELINSDGEPVQLYDIKERIAVQLGVANLNGYAHSIARAQLALAVTYTLLGLDDETNRRAARRYADMGLESCIRYSGGFFLWQLHNLMAIIELSERDADSSLAEGQLRTAISYLHRQGLLFVGALDSCSPNLAVISNYIKFLHQHHGDDATVAFVKTLSYYDKGTTDIVRQNLRLIASVREFGLLGRTRPLPHPLVERHSGLLLALR
ncbi:ATP-binding protein [Undibacterium sp.]|jgi:hypothetical protein|uniref:ATP-binding protein n=1 Tax=Undibacterium sp. TaxID=1914977 RepID=UPI002CC7ED23|nr:ATP-binding protein [Undibacterium sp.]HTD04018.1 ATP-binding protein [Undibacterium sp.]